MRHSDYGQNEFLEMRVSPDFKVVSYDYADLDASAHTLKIPVKAGTLVLGVGHLVTKAFAGGTPALTVGDNADADGYGAAAAYDTTTLNNFFYSGGGAGAFAGGKYYAADGYILLTHATGLTAGEAKVLINQMSLAGNWRVPDL